MESTGGRKFGEPDPLVRTGHLIRTYSQFSEEFEHRRLPG